MTGFVIFFHSCTSLFLNRERPTAIGQLRRQSPHYHQGPMKQIALGALTASQCAVKHGDMGGVEGAGGYSRMARQFAICCEKQTRNIQSAGVQKTEWHQQSASQAQSWPEA